MAEVKMTKNALRFEQNRLFQLQKYLPTLKLKKAMLQAEIDLVRLEILEKEKKSHEKKEIVEEFSGLFLETMSFDIFQAVELDEVKKRYENIAGVDVPFLEKITFKKIEYSLLDTPPWIDSAIFHLQKMVEANVEVDISKEKKRALEKELREVSIRVNLFEKRLIPKALQNIKKIKVFLGDQELAAVSRAKVAKTKMERKG